MKKKRELYTELSSVLRILVYVDTGNLSDEIKLQKGAEQEKKVKAICKKLGLNYGNFHKEAEKEWEGKVWR
ncbi:TPA: hypothetical protein H1012_01790 [archaeon]|nr:hypothetical protein [Candidatus Naiadarchaeales archaeon SRR2090159.bin1288]